MCGGRCPGGAARSRHKADAQDAGSLARTSGARSEGVANHVERTRAAWDAASVLADQPHRIQRYTSKTSASSRPLSMPWVRAMLRMYSSLA